jgi:hypothetical protein
MFEGWTEDDCGFNSPWGWSSLRLLVLLQPLTLDNGTHKLNSQGGPTMCLIFWVVCNWPIFILVATLVKLWINTSCVNSSFSSETPIHIKTYLSSSIHTFLVGYIFLGIMWWVQSAWWVDIFSTFMNLLYIVTIIF